MNGMFGNQHRECKQQLAKFWPIQMQNEQNVSIQSYIRISHPLNLLLDNLYSQWNDNLL